MTEWEWMPAQGGHDGLGAGGQDEVGWQNGVGRNDDLWAGRTELAGKTEWASKMELSGRMICGRAKRSERAGRIRLAKRGILFDD